MQTLVVVDDVGSPNAQVDWWARDWAEGLLVRETGRTWARGARIVCREGRETPRRSSCGKTWPRRRIGDRDWGWVAFFLILGLMFSLSYILNLAKRESRSHSGHRLSQCPVGCPCGPRSKLCRFPERERASKEGPTGCPPAVGFTCPLARRQEGKASSLIKEPACPAGNS